jgi:hypothetical protein
MTTNPNELFQHQQTELQVTQSAAAHGAFMTPFQQQSFLPIRFQEHLQVGGDVGREENKEDCILLSFLATKFGYQCCKYWLQYVDTGK